VVLYTILHQVCNCRFKVITYVVTQKGQQFTLVIAGDILTAAERDQISCLIMGHNTQTQQLFKHAARMQIAGDGAGQCLKTGGLTHAL